MTNYLQQQEEQDAYIARADRFDGFDCGDAYRDYDDDQLAMNEAWLADMNARGLL